MLMSPPSGVGLAGTENRERSGEAGWARGSPSRHGACGGHQKSRGPIWPTAQRFIRRLYRLALPLGGRRSPVRSLIAVRENGERRALEAIAAHLATSIAAAELAGPATWTEEGLPVSILVRPMTLIGSPGYVAAGRRLGTAAGRLLSRTINSGARRLGSGSGSGPLRAGRRDPSISRSIVLAASTPASQSG